MIALTSGIYMNCNVDKLLMTITNLITIEGITSLIGRASGMIFFEFKDMQDALDNPFATEADKGF